MSTKPEANRMTAAELLAAMDAEHEDHIRAGTYSGEGSYFYTDENKETAVADYARIRAAVAALIERNTELEKDAARLDAIEHGLVGGKERTLVMIRKTGEVWDIGFVNTGGFSSRRCDAAPVSLREAIDALLGLPEAFKAQSEKTACARSRKTTK